MTILILPTLPFILIGVPAMIVGTVLVEIYVLPRIENGTQPWRVRLNADPVLTQLPLFHYSYLNRHRWLRRKVPKLKLPGVLPAEPKLGVLLKREGLYFRRALCRRATPALIKHPPSGRYLLFLALNLSIVKRIKNTLLNTLLCKKLLIWARKLIPVALFLGDLSRTTIKKPLTPPIYTWKLLLTQVAIPIDPV